MSQISVKDANNATVAVELPLAPGRAAAASSRPVAWSNEDNATIGALTETVPATDTASSGLNGRLQRVAQRLTSLIALLPATLGQKTMANSLAVTVASDQGAVPVSGTFWQATQPVSGTFWQATQPVSGTVTANAGTGTFAVSAASLPLPTGASTAANQTALNALFPASLGQKAMAASLAVVIASDQSSLPVTPNAPSSSSRLLSAAATTNATSVKASAGTLRAIQGYNAKTSPVFLKLYNKATAPTVGTDTPVKTIYLPATSAFALDFGFTFSTGIAYALTGAAADADTTALVAGDIVCLNVDYI